MRLQALSAIVSITLGLMPRLEREREWKCESGWVSLAQERERVRLLRELGIKERERERERERARLLQELGIPGIDNFSYKPVFVTNQEHFLADKFTLIPIEMKRNKTETETEEKTIGEGFKMRKNSMIISGKTFIDWAINVLSNRLISVHSYQTKISLRIRLIVYFLKVSTKEKNNASIHVYSRPKNQSRYNIIGILILRLYRTLSNFFNENILARMLFRKFQVNNPIRDKVSERTIINNLVNIVEPFIPESIRDESLGDILELHESMKKHQIPRLRRISVSSIRVFSLLLAGLHIRILEYNFSMRKKEILKRFNKESRGKLISLLLVIVLMSSMAVTSPEWKVLFKG